MPVCSHCHRQIHAPFTERNGSGSYGTLEKLLEAQL